MRFWSEWRVSGQFIVCLSAGDYESSRRILVRAERIVVGTHTVPLRRLPRSEIRADQCHENKKCPQRKAWTETARFVLSEFHADIVTRRRFPEDSPDADAENARPDEEPCRADAECGRADAESIQLAGENTHADAESPRSDAEFPRAAGEEAQTDGEEGQEDAKDGHPAGEFCRYNFRKT